LRTGRYAVIFLHRQHSLQPFSRHYSHSTNPFLDLLEIVDDDERPATSTNPLFASPTTFQNPLHSSSATNGISVEAPSADPLPEVRVAAKHSAPMRSLLRSYQRVQDLGLLHRVAFVTVFDYLFLLRGIAQVIGRMRDPQGASIARRSMYYLAAAVSDFFVPQQKMVRARHS
jgi:phosphopantothenate-cysteine ligase